MLYKLLETCMIKSDHKKPETKRICDFRFGFFTKSSGMYN